MVLTLHVFYIEVLKVSISTCDQVEATTRKRDEVRGQDGP